jgi:hypothetical protein
MIHGVLLAAMILRQTMEKSKRKGQSSHQLSAVTAERKQLEDLVEVLLLGQDGAWQGTLVGLLLLWLKDRGRSARLCTATRRVSLVAWLGRQTRATRASYLNDSVNNMDRMAVVDASLLEGVVVVVKLLTRGNDSQKRGILLDVLRHLLAQRCHRVRAVREVRDESG